MTTIISSASYYGSGSSAVIDYLSEFDGVMSLTNYEFRFAHDPDGLSELEYNLVENFNRHNSGHALKRYKKLVDYYGDHFMVTRYEPFFNNNWKKLSYEYINSLVDFSFLGYWQYDFYDKGSWYEFWSKLPDRILTRTIWRNKPDKHFFFKKEITYASHPTEEKFLSCTQKYTDKLMKAANKENAPIVLVDQLVPSTNIERHIRYFNNLKVFVVDRDPRDIYLLAKYEWKDTIVPKDIELFCKWYIYTRSQAKHETWDKDKIMLIQFEDIVYKYEETTKKIREWIGLDENNHVNPKKYMNPEVSIKNTRYWESNPEYQKEAEIIAKLLPEYLYNYS
ncbi:hypothetical protein WHY35_02610 [Clostridium perfringens]|uniref:hypothetical protein n=1 Tax=Clostridium perfringens TaxID=1502 RepID=UPI001C87EBCF|nr:hypothetical protein [Clostridium perfringens]MDM0691996.1 hypothetical protein [Clostridium perfringens]